MRVKPILVHNNKENKPEKAYWPHNQVENQVHMYASLQSFCHREVSSIFKTLNKGSHSPA